MIETPHAYLEEQQLLFMRQAGTSADLLDVYTRLARDNRTLICEE